MNVLVAIYGHPEGYPPTLNAVSELCRISETVSLLGRNVLIPSWNYPTNCEVEYSSKYVDVRAAERSSIIVKCKYFYDFVSLLVRKARARKYDLILAYDPMGLFACWLVLFLFKNKPLLWYHNHDLMDLKKVRRYSIQWLAGKFEKKIFKTLDIFSLPALERCVYYPMGDLKGRFFFLPNFPSKKVYSNAFFRGNKIQDTIKILYQGSVGEGHGLEQIISMVNTSSYKKRLELSIIGPIGEDYKKKLQRLMAEHDAVSNVKFFESVPYRELPEFTSQHHIGIGILIPKDANYSTAATASNKICEYIACGLPVLLYDNVHFKEAFKDRACFFFTDTSSASLLECINLIEKDYSHLSKNARENFETEFCFENYFQAIIPFLKGR